MRITITGAGSAAACCVLAACGFPERSRIAGEGLLADSGSRGDSTAWSKAVLVVDLSTG